MNGLYLVLLIGAFTIVCDSIHYPISRNWYEPERAGAFVLTWVFCFPFFAKEKKGKSVRLEDNQTNLLGKVITIQ